MQRETSQKFSNINYEAVTRYGVQPPHVIYGFWLKQRAIPSRKSKDKEKETKMDWMVTQRLNWVESVRDTP